MYHIRSFFLGSEKNEPRSAAAVIGPRRSQTAPSSGAAELACGSDNPRPVPSSRLARSLPDKGGILRPFYLFPIQRPSPSFFSPFSPIGRTALRFGHSAPRRRIQEILGRGIPPVAPVWPPHQVRGDMGGLPKPPMHWITLYSMQNVFLLWGSGVGDFYFKRERRV